MTQDGWKAKQNTMLLTAHTKQTLMTCLSALRLHILYKCPTPLGRLPAHALTYRIPQGGAKACIDIPRLRPSFRQGLLSQKHMPSVRHRHWWVVDALCSADALSQRLARWSGPLLRLARRPGPLFLHKALPGPGEPTHQQSVRNRVTVLMCPFRMTCMGMGPGMRGRWWQGFLLLASEDLE